MEYSRGVLESSRIRTLTEAVCPGKKAQLPVALPDNVILLVLCRICHLLFVGFRSPRSECYKGHVLHVEASHGRFDSARASETGARIGWILVSGGHQQVVALCHRLVELGFRE